MVVIWEMCKVLYLKTLEIYMYIGQYKYITLNSTVVL